MVDHRPLLFYHLKPGPMDPDIYFYPYNIGNGDQCIWIYLINQFDSEGTAYYYLDN